MILPFSLRIRLPKRYLFAGCLSRFEEYFHKFMLLNIFPKKHNNIL